MRHVGSLGTGKNGTGAGRSYQNSGYAQYGDGKPKYVFGDTSVYDYPICAGGGGGTVTINSGQDAHLMGCYLGGEGRTNGGDGERYKTYTNEEIENLTDYSAPIVDGGYNGGGRAVRPMDMNDPSDGIPAKPATDATKYGSGGGEGALWRFDSQENTWRGYAIEDGGQSCGKGMPGAIFIRILK